MAADPVVPIVRSFSVELLEVETGQYYLCFDEVPEVGTEVTTRCDPRPAVWTACGILIGDLPACHHDAIRQTVHRGTVIWIRHGSAPAVRVELVSAADGNSA